MFATVSGSGTLSLQGAGGLTIGTLAAPITAQGSGNIHVVAVSGTPLSGFYELPVTGMLSSQTRATLDGAAVPLVWRGQNVYLPIPAAGLGYAAMLDGNSLTVVSQLLAVQNVPLTDADFAITVNGTYRLQGQKGAETPGKVSVAAGLQNVHLILDEAHLSAAAPLSIGNGAIVTLEVPASVSAATLGGGIALGADAAITVLGQGALTVRGITPANSTDHKASVSIQSNLTGIVELKNFAENNRVATVILVTDGAGAAVANRLITLKLGDGAPFERTTDAQGRVNVWGTSRLSGVDVAVLSETSVTAAIVGEQPTKPVDTPDITGISAKNNIIIFSTDNAGTAGVVYKVGTATQDIRDGYDPACAYAPMIGGECEIPGLEKGQIVSYRCVAAYAPDVALSAKTQDAFTFSEQSAFTAVKGRERAALTLKSGDLKMEYTGSPFVFDVSKVPSRLTVEYLRGGSWTTHAPSNVGSYTVRVIVPMQDPAFYPGQYDFTIRITKRVIYIYPGDYEKMQGEDDPDVFEFTYEPALITGDRITGKLTRQSGEEPGNYPYVLSRLVAPEYYDLRLGEDASLFYIYETPHSWLDPMDRIDPVYQVLRFSGGKKLDLLIKTTEKLVLGVEEYGGMVFDGLDGNIRPFSPSMRLMPRHDKVLLILRAEAELNRDHGYATDADGHVVYRPRTLYLTLDKMKRLQKQNVSHVLFQLNGAGLMVSLDELRSDEMRALLKAQGTSLTQGRFRLTLEPVSGQDDLLSGEAGAQTAARMALPLMRMNVSFVAPGNQVIDVSSALQDMTVVFSQDALTQPETQQQQASVVETKDGRVVSTGDAQTVSEFAQRFDTALDRVTREGYALCRYEALPAALDTLLIVPYTSSEEEAAYRSLMQSATYLMTHVRTGGLYGVSNTQWLAQ